MISRLATTLWPACWQTLLLVAVVWLISRFAKNVPASVKAWLWWLAALRLVIGLFWAGFELPILPYDAQLSIEKPVESLLAGAPYLPMLLACLWAAGCLYMCGSIMTQGFRLAGIRRRAYPADATPSGEIAREIGARMGLPDRPVVLHSEELSAPLVAGFWRPALILPDDLESTLTESELRQCIAHELAHLHRRDLTMAIVPTLMQVAFYFFPPAWIARREWETEREAACDVEAIAVTGADPEGYSRLLMKLVTADYRGAVAPALGATASYHTLKHRIQNMKQIRTAARAPRFATLTLGALAVLLALPFRVTAGSLPLQDANVLSNPGFEQGTKGWEYEAMFGEPPTKIAVDNSTYHAGKASLRFERTAPGFSPVAMMGQSIALDGRAKQVRFSFWAKCDKAAKFTMVAGFPSTKGIDREWGIYIGDREGRGTTETNDWKQFTGSVKIPAGVESAIITLEMYGPGTVWVDDVSATLSATDTPEDPAADVADVKNEDLRAGNDPLMRYFLIGGHQPAPEAGYKLLVVLPGGDGSANFNPFIRRVWKNALPPGYLIAELVAPKWSEDQAQQLVWPTRKVKWQGMKFATEDFIDKVIQDVKKRQKIDKVFSLSWSSGGPAAYAASLTVPGLKGSFVAMSVFRPEELPALFAAKGHAYYLLQSPDDTVTILNFAQTAQKELLKAGAKVELKTYAGGHGWRGDVFGNIRSAIEWLEKNAG